MPTYQYRCTDCADELEVVQKFTDDPLTTCPSCQGTLRKVFSPVGVVFKGSGFYATDNRSKGKANAAKHGDKTHGDKGHHHKGHHDKGHHGSSDHGGKSSGEAASTGGTAPTGTSTPAPTTAP